MAIAPTIKYFGKFITSIVLQCTDAFNGAAQTGTPVITPGVYTFPAQAGGGLFNYHDESIVVEQISYTGGGNLTVIRAGAYGEVTIATVSSNGTLNNHIHLTPGEWLKFTSVGSGGGKIVCSSRSTMGEAVT